MARREDEDKGGLSANATLAIGLVLCAALVVAVIVGSRFSTSAPPPRAAPVAQTTEQVVTTGLKWTVGYYKASVEDAAKKLGLPIPTLESMAAPLEYANELPASRMLKLDRDQVDTPHLHLATHVVKEWSTTGAAQQMRVEHIMLTITNKTNRPIAYRIDTAVSDPQRCRSKGVLVQNAIALKPNETIERSECFWYKNATLELRAVEVLELTDIGYYFASRLSPSQALLDERTTAGHEVPGKLKPCAFVPWREIKTAAERKDGVRWSDVVDFYARHDCDEYSFFTSYRRWTRPGSLPAREGAPPLEPTAKSR